MLDKIRINENALILAPAVSLIHVWNSPMLLNCSIKTDPCTGTHPPRLSKIPTRMLLGVTSGEPSTGRLQAGALGLLTTEQKAWLDPVAGGMVGGHQFGPKTSISTMFGRTELWRDSPFGKKRSVLLETKNPRFRIAIIAVGKLWCVWQGKC